MGKSSRDKKHKKKKDKKDKKDKDKKRKVEYSSSDSDRDAKRKRSKYDDSPTREERRRERKEKRDRKKQKRRDYSSSSSSSSSSSDSSSEDERDKRSKRSKDTPIMNTALLGTIISNKDYESVRMKFRVWLEQDEKIDIPLSDVESKTELWTLHFGKFSQLWNEGKLDAKYYHKVEEENKPSVYSAPSGVTKGPSMEMRPDETKFTVKGDGGLSDRYLTGGREVPWIQQRVNQMKKSKEKRANRLSAKAEAYQEKEKEKMDEFKRIMGLS